MRLYTILYYNGYVKLCRDESTIYTYIYEILRKGVITDKLYEFDISSNSELMIHQSDISSACGIVDIDTFTRYLKSLQPPKRTIIDNFIIQVHEIEDAND